MCHATPQSESPKASKRVLSAPEVAPRKRLKTQISRTESGQNGSPIEVEPEVQKSKRKQGTKDLRQKVAGQEHAAPETLGPRSGPSPPEQDFDSPLSDVDSKIANTSDSDLSTLADGEPKPKKAKGKRPTKPRVRSKRSSGPATNTSADPDAAEIKRLQGWLLKCGIRKVWGKELKPYNTPKAKIKHLKEMLTDVGMTGRYSLEKASQIKDARELAADIEAVQEGAERWGKSPSNSESDTNSRPKRRLVRGTKNYDFLSSGGEETD